MTEEDLERRRIALDLKPDDFYIVHSDAMSAITKVLHHVFDRAPDEAAVVEIHGRIDELQKLANYNDAMQCSKQSCSFCCHSEIFIGKPEADFIKKHGTYEIDKEKQARQRATKDYSKLSFADKACIMLKDGKCQVYEHRPSLCRNHGIALGEDPHDCFKQSRDLGQPGLPTVKIQQPRMIALEAMATYITVKGAKGPEDVKNIAEYNW